MSFNNSNGNAGPPCGSIIATLATSDPPGWIIADGENRTYSTIYDKLIDMSIGTRPTGYYKPPNLKGAFLRATGENTFNSIAYNGQSIKAYAQDKFEGHIHTATQGNHGHNNNTVDDLFSSTHGALGLGYISGFYSEAISEDDGYGEHNLIYLEPLTRYGQSLATSVGTEKTTEAQPTIDKVSNTGDTETAPYCYGVNWAIKI